MVRNKLLALIDRGANAIRFDPILCKDLNFRSKKCKGDALLTKRVQRTPTMPGFTELHYQKWYFNAFGPSPIQNILMALVFAGFD